MPADMGESEKSFEYYRYKGGCNTLWIRGITTALFKQVFGRTEKKLSIG